MTAWVGNGCSSLLEPGDDLWEPVWLTGVDGLEDKLWTGDLEDFMEDFVLKSSGSSSSSFSFFTTPSGDDAVSVLTFSFFTGDSLFFLLRSKGNSSFELEAVDDGVPLPFPAVVGER